MSTVGLHAAAVPLSQLQGLGTAAIGIIILLFLLKEQIKRSNKPLSNITNAL